MHRIMIARERVVRLVLRAKASLSIVKRNETRRDDSRAFTILSYAEIAVRRRGICILFYSR